MFQNLKFFILSLSIICEYLGYRDTMTISIIDADLVTLLREMFVECFGLNHVNSERIQTLDILTWNIYVYIIHINVLRFCPLRFQSQRRKLTYRQCIA